MPASRKTGQSKSRPNAAATYAESGARGSTVLAPSATARWPTNMFSPRSDRLDSRAFALLLEAHPLRFGLTQRGLLAANLIGQLLRLLRDVFELFLQLLFIATGFHERFAA